MKKKEKPVEKKEVATPTVSYADYSDYLKAKKEQETKKE